MEEKLEEQTEKLNLTKEEFLIMKLKNDYLNKENKKNLEKITFLEMGLNEYEIKFSKMVS